jgi:peptide chain release factor subunit 1
MAANSITRSRLRRLADVSPDRGRVLSVFLNLDPSQIPTPAARASAITSIMTEAAHCVEAAEALEHDEREALKADVERVREVLEGDIGGNGSRAVAVFACQPENLLEVVPLRQSLDSRVVLDRKPHVEPLVHSGDERWCVVLVNRRLGRIFTGDGDALEETDRIEDDVHRQHDQGGWSQARYQRSVDKDKDDHLQRTADAVFALHKRRGFDKLLVGGPEELIGDLEAALHSYLQDTLAGRVTGCPVEHATVDEVRACAAEKIAEHDRQSEREALDRMTEGIGRGERGVGGLPRVLDALNEQRVEILLIERGFSVPGFIGEDGLLYAAALPGAEPCDDIVEKAIEKAIEQSARVIGVRYHEDLGPVGNIGAVLRY